MKLVLTFLAAQAALAAIWLSARIPFVDVVVFASSAGASLALLGASVALKQRRAAMAIVMMGVMLFAGYRHAVRQSHELAVREFSRLVDSGEACRLVADTFPNKQWSTRVEGFYARPVEYLGATSDLLFVNAWSPAELRLAPLVGEMQLARLDGTTCPPHGTARALPH